MSEENVVSAFDGDIDLEAPCFGHTIKQGRNKGKWSNHKGHAREALTKAKGPPLFPKAVCRHLCKNDSTCPNGFVCCNPDHLKWGTQQENVLDQDPEVRKEKARKMKASLTPEERSENGRKGNKALTPEQKSKGGRKAAASPTHPNKLLVTCPHCEKVGKKLPMMRWHFDGCPSRSPSDDPKM